MLSKTERHYLITGLVLSTGESPKSSYERHILAGARRKAEAALADFTLLSKDARFADLIARLQRVSAFPGPTLDFLDKEEE